MPHNSDHMLSDRVHGPCSGSSAANKHSTGEFAHVVGWDLFCAACCPVCKVAQ